MRLSKTANRNSGFRNGFPLNLPFPTTNQPISASQFFRRKASFPLVGWFLPIFLAKMVVSGLGPGDKNCPQSEKEENRTFVPAKVVLSPSQPAVAG